MHTAVGVLLGSVIERGLTGRRCVRSERVITQQTLTTLALSNISASYSPQGTWFPGIMALLVHTDKYLSV